MLGTTAPLKPEYPGCVYQFGCGHRRKFDLTFDNCHTYWHCDVIWRDDRFDNRVVGPQIRVKKRIAGSTARDNEGSGVTHCPLLRLSSLCTVTLRP
jgi:hypothetical protein